MENKKEVKIEDFISQSELDSMTDREREIYEQAFSMNKSTIQGMVDALNLIKNFT